MYPDKQLQMARRLRASHWALIPHVPDSQMLTQREAEHCWERPQSSSLVHCGPHPVMVSGLGKNPALQRQMATPSELTLHSVLGPQGYGVHGSENCAASGATSRANDSRSNPPILNLVNGDEQRRR